MKGLSKYIIGIETSLGIINSRMANGYTFEDACNDAKRRSMAYSTRRTWILDSNFRKQAVVMFKRGKQVALPFKTVL